MPTSLHRAAAPAEAQSCSVFAASLGLALQNYQSTHGGVQWHFSMAASCVTILPVLVLFFFAQRTFIQGIATTGSKS